VHIYIGFETLKVKCTQYGICSQAAFTNARAMFFSKLGGAGNSLWSGSKKSRVGAKISREGCPRPDLTLLIVRRGGLNVAHVILFRASSTVFDAKNGIRRPALRGA